MFAAEVGMEVPLYNAAMLCEENQVRLNCIKYYKVRLHVVSPYNKSPRSILGNGFSLLHHVAKVCCDWPLHECILAARKLRREQKNR